MRNFSPGLFDRLVEPDAAPTSRQQAIKLAKQRCRDSITRDLVALLNTRSAMQAQVLAPYPAVEGSVMNYGLIDFAGMCMTSDTDQEQICRAVRVAIERHEPRLQNVNVTLRPKKDSINRVEFAITAELKGAIDGDHMAFDAVFRPSLQQYSIENVS
jgi:type VI secretion system protein ImpF